MLTAFFNLNKKYKDTHQFTYQELPMHYIWDRQTKLWRSRQHGSAIGHVYFVPPTARECFYLRTLLTTVKGSTSWEDLRTYDSVVHPTFHTTCLARGRLENDNEWQQCLEEASLTHVGESLRHLFSLLLRHCQPLQPDVLWTQFCDALCDNLNRQLQHARDSTNDIPIHDIYNYSLFLINEDLHLHGSFLSSFPSMPTIDGHWQ
jgi:hypothetical protein